MKSEEAIAHELEELIITSGLPLDHIIGPATEERVAMAERMIKSKFPKSYRLFLLHYGAIRYGDHEILGLFDEERNEDFGFTDVAKHTLRYRASYNLVDVNMNDLIFLAQDQDGTAFYSNAAYASEDKIPIFAAGLGFANLKVGNDFLDFFRRLLQSESAQPFGF